MNIILSLLGISLSFAAPDSERIKSVLEKQTDCQNFVRYDDRNIYLGFGKYKHWMEEPRQPIPAFFKVVPLGGGDAFTLNTADAALDIITEGDQAYVLTYSSLEQWDLGSRAKVAEFPTLIFGQKPLKNKEHAEGFARFGQKLIIAHGELGISIFDLQKKRITNQFKLVQHRLPLESMASAVVMQGKYAYVLIDGRSIVPPGEKNQPFRGLVVVDMESERVVSELDGLDYGVDAIAARDGKIFVSYYGMPVWKYDARKFQGKRLPVPEERLTKFPFINSHPTGAASVDDTYYYTCFVKGPQKPGDTKFEKFPLAIDRREFKLD
jgi:hypothetical protein